MSIGSDIEIREGLRLCEVEEIARAHSSVFYKEFGYNEKYHELVHTLYLGHATDHGSDERMWIVEYDERLVGSIGIFKESDDVARLRLLFVHPDARNMGVGTDLMERALAFARKKGYHSIVLMTEDILEDAGRLYRRFGFQLKESEERSMWGRSFQLQTYEKKLD